MVSMREPVLFFLHSMCCSNQILKSLSVCMLWHPSCCGCWISNCASLLVARSMFWHRCHAMIQPQKNRILEAGSQSLTSWAVCNHCINSLELPFKRNCSTIKSFVRVPTFLMDCKPLSPCHANAACVPHPRSPSHLLT